MNKLTVTISWCLLAWGCGAGSTATGPTTQPTETVGEKPPTVEPNIELGEQVYGRVCVTCHGPEGDGKGLEQELFSFATPAEQWKNGPTVGGILATLDQGVHQTSMQPFPEFGPLERESVALYVLQLREELLAEGEAPSSAQ